MTQVTSKVMSNIKSNTEKLINTLGYRSATFDIAGTATSASVVFEIIAGSGIPRPVYPVKVSGNMDIVEKAAMNEIYNFDVTGITAVIIKVTSITGGYVDVHMTGVV